MRIKESRSFPRQELDTLLARVPFYREIQAQDAWQFELLLQLTQCIELDPHELIMSKGERGDALYFLIRGQLGVFIDDQQTQPVWLITPGESFGDLALVTQSARRATVRAVGERGAQLVAMDFRPLMDLKDFTSLNLRSKLTFYRQLVHSIRWRLEAVRIKQPDHPAFADLRKVKPFAGQRDSAEELRSLGEQAKLLAEILLHWNDSSGGNAELLGAAPASEA